MIETMQVLGNAGDFIGAVGVVVTLVYLAIQVRHSARLLEISIDASKENARLARAAAIDWHSDAVSRWRGRLIEHVDVAQLWQDAINGKNADGADHVRLENLLVDWVNTYRSNFYRAKAVDDEGLARQAVVSVAPLITESQVLQEFWERGRPINETSAKDFVEAVDRELRLNSGQK